MRKHWRRAALALVCLRGLSFTPAMDKEALLRRALGAELQNQQTMGFTGATVGDVLLEGERLFLKVVEPAPLPATATVAERQKWERNLQSYANEVSFLSNAELQQALEKNNVSVPKLLGYEAVPGQRYTILTENLKDGWSMFPVHPKERTHEVVQWLGNFHGTFLGALPKHELWEVGTHVHLERRPPGEVDLLAESVQNLCEAFAGEDAYFQRPETRTLGAALQRLAAAVSQHLTPGPENQQRVTLVHGDFKGANYFLRNEGAGCCAIDWQWTGPGIGATDLIYLFMGSVEDEIVADYQRWLELYHQSLAAEYSYDEFLLDFKVATLDYARWVFAYRLKGDTPEKFRQRAENVDVNLGLFRRHIPRMCWLLQRVEEFLPEVEAKIR